MILLRPFNFSTHFASPIYIISMSAILIKSLQTIEYDTFIQLQLNSIFFEVFSVNCFIIVYRTKVLQFSFPINPIQLCYLATLCHTANNADAACFVKFLTKSKQIQTSRTKTSIHKAVRNGITTTGTVCQQMEVTNRLVAEMLVD